MKKVIEKKEISSKLILFKLLGRAATETELNTNYRTLFDKEYAKKIKMVEEELGLTFKLEYGSGNYKTLAEMVKEENWERKKKYYKAGANKKFAGL